MCCFNIGTLENVEDKYTGRYQHYKRLDMRDFTKLDYLGYVKNKW